MEHHFWSIHLRLSHNSDCYASALEKEITPPQVLQPKEGVKVKLEYVLNLRIMCCISIIFNSRSVWHFHNFGVNFHSFVNRSYYCFLKGHVKYFIQLRVTFQIPVQEKKQSRNNWLTALVFECSKQLIIHVSFVRWM